MLKYEGNFAAFSSGWNCGVAVSLKFVLIFSLALSGGGSLHVVTFDVGGLRKFSGMDFSVI